MHQQVTGNVDVSIWMINSQVGQKKTISQRLKKFYISFFWQIVFLYFACLFPSLSSNFNICGDVEMQVKCFKLSPLVGMQIYFAVRVCTYKFAWTRVKPNIQTAFDISIHCWAFGIDQSLSALDTLRPEFEHLNFLWDWTCNGAPVQYNIPYETQMSAFWILWRVGYWRAPQQLQRLITNHFFINNHHRQMADILPHKACSIKS